jgi:hypothetical protein
VWVTADPKKPKAYIGIGSGEPSLHGTPGKSIALVVNPNPPGNLTFYTREGFGKDGFGAESAPGEYVVRVGKKGNAVSFSIGAEENGVFTADFSKSYHDITTAESDLDADNMHIFFGGGQFRQLRLTATAKTKPAAESDDVPAQGAIVPLDPTLTPYLDCDKSFSLARTGGLLLPNGAYIRTRKGDFLNRDFVMDVWLTLDPKKPTADLGLRSGVADLGGLCNSVYLSIDPRGNVNIFKAGQNPQIEGSNREGVGQEIDAGIYVVRVEKKEPAVTFSLGKEEKDAFVADFTRAFSDISKTPADFNNNNVHLFFGGGQFKQVRISATPGN